MKTLLYDAFDSFRTTKHFASITSQQLLTIHRFGDRGRSQFGRGVSQGVKAARMEWPSEVAGKDAKLSESHKLSYSYHTKQEYS